MTIKIGTYTFNGPYDNTNPIEDRSGVYAILRLNSNGRYSVIDIGESKEVKNRLDNHDRLTCWAEHCPHGWKYAVHYTPNAHQSGRMEIEQALRQQYTPPCGKR